MDEEMLRCYLILELKPGASTENIREAYIDLVKVWHPDRFCHDPALQRKAQEKLKEVNRAYEILNACRVEMPEENTICPPEEEEDRGLQVDRFIYRHELCDEVDLPSKLARSEWSKVELTDAGMVMLADYAKRLRGVEYVLGGGMRLRHLNVVTRADFKQRRIHLNRSVSVGYKSAVLPLAMFYIRDKLRGSLKGNLPLVHGALRRAGWSGVEWRLDENYLRAELVLSNLAAEYILERNLKKPSGWSAYWQDLGSHLKLKRETATLEQCGVWIGYNTVNEAIGGSSLKPS